MSRPLERVFLSLLFLTVDPTALERGAKALKELDSSPNAAKAFEVTKLQEQTKQKQLQKEMEEVWAPNFWSRRGRDRVSLRYFDLRVPFDHVAACAGGAETPMYPLCFCSSAGTS